MKRFLGAWEADPETLGISLSQVASDTLLKTQGVTSPLLPAAMDGVPAELGAAGVLVFIIPKSTSALLATLMNDMGEAQQQSVYLSHGHASVVLLVSDAAVAQATLNVLGEACRGYEIWPYEGGLVSRELIIRRFPARQDDWENPTQIADQSLAFESAAQVRQFNANVAVLSRLASQYAPELRPLLSWLGLSVGDLATQLRELSSSDDDFDVRRSIGLESVLVEVNAVVTLFCSQLGSGCLPLGQTNFPVGEYSMLGIGGVNRAVWRLYSHLNETFADFDHPGLLKRQYGDAGSFDWRAASDRRDYGDWQNSNVSINRISDKRSEGARYHIPYLSSRWGFHESLHSISVSWQCLYASATKEWNLLTLTHEFLHSHVRDLLGQVLNPNSGATRAELARRWNAKELGTNAWQSMQMAYIEALVGIRGCSQLARRIVPEEIQNTQVKLPDILTEDSIDDLVRSHSGLVHEIVVHVLDFMYTYGAQDTDYINSVWSSWSLVPSVNDRIDHYVLRSLCALAASSDELEPTTLFDDVVGRLRRDLAPLLTRTRIRPAIRQAIQLLDDPLRLRRLEIEFVAARYVVRLTIEMLYDSTLNADLVRDDLTAVLDGRTTYAVPTGTYRGEPVTSPVGFLLDRFTGYEDQAGSVAAEFESLWQVLQLI